MRPLPLIYLVRHGQTDWNAEDRFQGGKDIPLNDHGRGQARGNGEALARLIGRGEGYDFVSSPLSRARETMEIVRREMGLDPTGYRVEERLREVCYGDWEGQTFSDLEAQGGDPWERRERDKWNFRPTGEGAESYADMTDRVAAWLGDVERRCVVAAHGGIIRSLFRLLGDRTSDEAAHEPTPQDRVLRIEGNTIGWM